MTKVLKFGGTSVGSSRNMKKVAEIVRNENARITVLSAMSGTTDSLVRIASAAAAGDRAPVEEQLAMLTRKYTDCICELLAVHRDHALGLMEKTFALIRREADGFRGDASARLIVAQGELLTSAIFTTYLREAGMNAVCLNSPDFMVTDAEQKVDAELLRRSLGPVAADGDTFYIAQGFICTNARGEIDNLGRGGSDYSAALMGAAIDASEVQIWTDIDGMHNNDPRFVENTYPIRNMSFDEAAELAYFGAKILHPAAIQPCKDRGIAVMLRNTMDPCAPGTTISDRDDDSKSFHAVAAKDGITVIRIHSARMLMAYGFLRKVFEIFEQYRTPIDMITTSEVAVSLTVDNDAHIDEIVRELETLGTIEIERNNSIVCVVGRMEHGDAGLAASVFDSVKHIPIKMISYGASHRSMAMLIGTDYKKPMLQSLNDGLFYERP